MHKVACSIVCLLQRFLVGATAPCVTVVSLLCIGRVEGAEYLGIRGIQLTALELYCDMNLVAYPYGMPFFVLNGESRVLTRLTTKQTCRSG